MSSELAAILSNDSKRLQAALTLDGGSARIEVQCLLQEVLQVNRAYLLTHPERQLDAELRALYAALFERRLRGEPLAYILGKREFYGLDFQVTPATLIPRPDTELLVELALERIPYPPAPLPKLSPQSSGGTTSHSTRLANNASQVAGYPASGESEARGAQPGKRENQFSTPAGEGGRQAGRGFRVLDLGTGSGAVALAIAHTRPDAEVTAVDASPDALGVARENASRLHIGNVRLLRSDWFSALVGERFDLIVSNPPYISEADMHLSLGDLRFEPLSALASGADGLKDIRCIVARAGDYLDPGGWLLFEHGYDQAEQARELLLQAGFGEVFSACDLAGIERVTAGSFS